MRAAQLDWRDTKIYGQIDCMISYVCGASPRIVLIHSGLEIVYANPGFCALVDAESQDQLIGTELVDMVSSDYHSPLRDRVTRLERGDDPTFGLTVEFQTFTDQPLRAILVGSVVDWDGTERVQTSVFPIRDGCRQRSASLRTGHGSSPHRHHGFRPISARQSTHPSERWVLYADRIRPRGIPRSELSIPPR